MTTKEKIEVMKAYAEGKKIEWKPKGCQGWDEWTFNEEPTWNWNECDFRIKPEPTYRPYKDTDEMIEDFKKRFNVEVPPYALPEIWVENKFSKVRRLITGFRVISVDIYDSEWSMNELFNRYTYLDGSPCGMKED